MLKKVEQFKNSGQIVLELSYEGELTPRFSNQEDIVKNIKVEITFLKDNTIRITVSMLTMHNLYYIYNMY